MYQHENLIWVKLQFIIYFLINYFVNFLELSKMIPTTDSPQNIKMLLIKFTYIKFAHCFISPFKFAFKELLECSHRLCPWTVDAIK
jgi:hypothetical protein